MRVGPRPLIGRADVLHDALTTLRSGQSVAFIGEAGIGKTRLAAAAIDQLSRSHHAERVLASSAVQSLQFGALAALGYPPDGRSQHVEPIVAWYVERWRLLASDEPVIVWVDDAHLLDQGSAQVLVAGVQSKNIVLLATRRTPHRPPEAWDRLDDVAEFALDRLTRAECHELLRSDPSADDQSDPQLVSIIESSAGVPLFALDLCRAASNGIQGESLRSMTDQRLLALSPPARTLAEWLALVDRMSVDLADALESDGSLEELEAESFTSFDPNDETIRLAHPIYRSRLKIALDEPHAFGAMLDRIDARNAHSLVSETTLARWTTGAERELDVDVAIRAAAESMGRLDHREAARFVAGVPDGPAVELIRARIDIASGRDDEGIRRLERCLESDDTAAHLAALSELVRTFVFSNRASAGREALRQSATRDRGPLHLRTLLSLRAMAHAFDGADPGLIREVRDYLETTTIDDYASMSLASSCAMSLSGEGDFAAAAALLERGRQYLDSSGADLAPMMRDRVASAQVLHHLWTGAHGRAVTEAGRAHQVALDERCHENELLRAHQLSTLAGVAGDYATAARLAEDTYEARAHANLFDTSDRSSLLAAAALLGDHQLAERARAIEVRETSIPYKLVSRLVAEFLHDRANGRDGGAADLRVAMEQLLEFRHLGWLATSAVGLLLVEPEAWVIDLVRSAADQSIEPGLIHPLARFATGLAGADPVALEDSAAQLEQLGIAHLAAASWAAAGRLQAEVHPARAFRAEHAAERNLARCSAMAACWLPSLPRILTARQRAVVSLVASGATTSQIAAHDSVSHRTVGNHLHATYKTLGLSGRAELVELLTPPSTIPESAISVSAIL